MPPRVAVMISRLHANLQLQNGHRVPTRAVGVQNSGAIAQLEISPAPTGHQSPPPVPYGMSEQRAFFPSDPTRRESLSV